MSHERKFPVLIKNFILMEVRTEEYGNIQIISTDYTEVFYNCFHRNYKLSTFNIFMKILVPASPNVTGCRTMQVRHCSLRCLNISDIVISILFISSEWLKEFQWNFQERIWNFDFVYCFQKRIIISEPGQYFIGNFFNIFKWYGLKIMFLETCVMKIVHKCFIIKVFIFSPL